MSVTDGIISLTDPISTEDVRSVLGENTHDIGALCKSGSIKKFAKYKPEAIGGKEPISLIQRKDNNFGLSPAAVYNSKYAFITACKNGTFTGGWDYKRVDPYVINDKGEIAGGRGDWARLSDFRGYNSNARSPFGDLMPGRFVITSDTTMHLLIPASSPPPDEDALSLSDFQKGGYDFKNWYFGVLLYNDSNTIMATATTNLNNPQADWQVDFGNTIGPSYKGTYTGVPFIASKPFTVTGAEPSGLMIVGVENQGVSIELITTTDQYPMIGSCSYPNLYENRILYSVQIVNNTGTAKTFSNVTLHIATDDKGTNATVLKSFGTVTVAANSTWAKSETVNFAYGDIASLTYQWSRLTYTGATDSKWISFEATAQTEEVPG